MLKISNLNLSHGPTLNLSQGPVFDSIKKKKKKKLSQRKILSLVNKKKYDLFLKIFFN